MTVKTRRARGFALLEVLVSVVVLGIGLLGLAGLQVTGVASNHSAYIRSQATLQAYDIADRMRANIAGLSDYTKPPAITDDCTTVVGCEPAEMAQHDLAEWAESNAALLPGGHGVVCMDSHPDDGSPDDPMCDNLGDAFIVKVWWSGGQQKMEQRFVTSFQP